MSAGIECPLLKNMTAVGFMIQVDDTDLNEDDFRNVLDGRCPFEENCGEVHVRNAFWSKVIACPAALYAVGNELRNKGCENYRIKKEGKTVEGVGVIVNVSEKVELTATVTEGNLSVSRKD